MLQEVEVTNPVGRRLKIEIPTAVVEKKLDEVYKQLGTTVNIPGFRKGKVPRTILERRFSKNVEEEVVSTLVPEFYSEAVKEAGIVPVSQPNIEGDVKIEKDQPLSFSITVEVKPEISDLKYEGLEIEEVEAAVTDEDIQNALKTLQEQKVSFEPTEEGAREGDMLVIDYKGSIDGEPVKELEEEDYQYIVGSHTLPQKFGQELLGKNKGDSCEFTVLFNDDFHNKIVAGETVPFKVAVKEVKKKIVPVVDDELAKDFDYESLEELKTALSRELQLKKEKERNTLYRNSLVKILMDTHNVESPPSMAKVELDALVRQAKNIALQSGMKQPNDDDLYNVYRDTDVNNVKAMLILSAIGALEDVEVSDDEVKERIEEIAKNSAVKADEIVKMYVAQDGSLDGFKQQLYTDKVIDIVLSKANIKKKSSLIV